MKGGWGLLFMLFISALWSRNEAFLIRPGTYPFRPEVWQSAKKSAAQRINEPNAQDVSLQMEQVKDPNISTWNSRTLYNLWWRATQKALRLMDKMKKSPQASPAMEEEEFYSDPMRLRPSTERKPKIFRTFSTIFG